MKINRNYQNYNKYNKVNQKKDVAQNNKVGKDKNIDVQISNSTRKLVGSLKEAEEKGISAKVEAIKKAIQSGHYKIDEKTIAKKIMDNIYIQEGESIDE